MTFRVTLPCTRAEAETLGDDIPQFAALEAPPVLVTSEAEGDAWRLDAYFEDRPGEADLALLRSLVTSTGGASSAANCGMSALSASASALVHGRVTRNVI